MRIGSYRFAPGVVSTLAALVAFGLLLSLGFWQLGRGEEKAAIQAEFARRMNEPPVDLDRIAPGAGGNLYRRGKAEGRYDTELVLLVDNSVRQGRPGYQVVSPLRLGTTGRWVLVDRGWIALGASRQRLPDVPPPAGEVSVMGYLARPQRPPLTLGASPALRGAGTQVVPWIEPDTVGAALGADVLPLVLRQQGPLDPGLLKEWPLLNMSAERHHGYAFQWFALAATLVLIYLFVNLKRLPAE